MFESVVLKLGFLILSQSSPGNLLKRLLLRYRLTPTNSETLTVGSACWVLISPPGDYNTGSSLRTTSVSISDPGQ